MITPRPPEPGGLIEESQRDQLIKGRRTAWLSWLRTDRNLWAGFSLCALLVTAGATYNAYLANKRFAEDVRVRWVKLSPDGTYAIEYEDKSKPFQYYKANVESKLTEWAQKRFQKRKATIKSDYGFANAFMTPQLSGEFVRTFNAPKIAAEHEACGPCPDVFLKVWDLRTDDEDVSPTNVRQFKTQLWALERTVNPEGQTVQCRNQIITLIWKFKPIAEIVKFSRDELNANPLGQEIITADVRGDPTPINVDSCLKQPGAV